MSYKSISTPRGTIIVNERGKAELTWNPSFAATRNGNFTRIQKFVDSETLRRCSPRVPFQTGMLDRSGKLGTVVGSGEVQYIAPYAMPQYYNTFDSRPYDPNRGARWFERMKVAEKGDILEGAKKLRG